MAQKLGKWGTALGVLWVSGARVMAQEPGLPTPAGAGLANILEGIVASLVYSILGIIVLLVGFKILNLVTPFDINKEIAEDDNVAVGVLAAGMMIGLGIIIAAAIL